MFLLQGQSETVNDGSKDLQELRNPVVTLGLVDEVEEDVVDATSDRCAEIEELSVYPMKRGLQEVTLPGVFRIEQLEQVEDEVLVNVALGKVRVELRAFDETQEEFVNDLKMRPCKLENRLILFRIKCVSRRVGLRGYRTEEIRCKLGKLRTGSAGHMKLFTRRRTMLTTSGYILSVITFR